jgi:hypothetical protein
LLFILFQYQFLNKKSGEILKGSSPSGAIPVRLDQLLPKDITERIRSACNGRCRGPRRREAHYEIALNSLLQPSCYGLIGDAEVESGNRQRCMPTVWGISSHV